MLNRLTKHQDWLFAGLAALYTALFVIVADGGFPLDDSWIHQGYGRNLALRGEWSLIAGQPSAASTAPLYTVLLAIGYLLRIPYTVWPHILGAFALALIGVSGARLATRLLPSSKYAGLLTGVLLVSVWQLVWAAASGMETALSAMWTLLLPWLAWRESDGARIRTTWATLCRGVVFGILGALAILTRPEAVLIVGLSGLALLITLPGGLRATSLWVLGALLGFCVFITPYLWLNLTLAGGLLPNTSAAKQVQHLPLLTRPYSSRYWDLTERLFIGGQIFLIPGIIVFLFRLRPFRQHAFAWVLLLWPLGLLAAYAARLPATYQHGRYVMPAIPALVVMGVCGTLVLLEMGRRYTWSRVLTRVLAASAFMGIIAMLLGLGPGIYARDVAVIDQEMVAAAAWIDANIPTDELMAIHDIGAVAYFTPRTLLDIAGLVSPEAIPYINDPEGMWHLIESRDAAYLMAFPDQIPGDDPTDERLCEVFTTNGQAAQDLNAANMTIYALSWGGECSR
ncbi:MAG: hypothetical protein AAF125_15145 [Chloroflexota bacterium]